MTKIIAGRTQCKIIEEDDVSFIQALDRELSFKVPGAEHTWAFKQGQWNGVKHVLTPALSFPYGLLKRVKGFYSDREKEFEIVSKRPGKTQIFPIDVESNLASIDRIPYQYQLDTLEAVKKNDCGIIRIATGGGKSLCAAMMTAHFGKRAIVYVIGKDLLYQIHEFFSRIFDQEIGIVGDGKCEIHDINVVSVWTVGQALGLESKKILLDTTDKEKSIDKGKYKDILDLMRTAKLHIFDECHLASCDTIQLIASKINPEYVYGMSASPWRDDGLDLLIEGVFGSTIIDISASQLIRGGYLARPIIKFVKVPKQTFAKKDTYPTVYKQYITENEARNRLVVMGANKLVEQGYRPLVLFSKLKHGKLLYDEIRKTIPCMALSGKDSAKTRQEAKDKLENGDIKCIVASTIFDIGVDLPALSGLVIAGGGKSSVRACQRIGRVIRKYPGKKHAGIIDFLDQAKFLKRHSAIRYKIYATEEEFDLHWPK
ncbi:MAG: hypothetical protein CMB80_31210 [Flammeovirgaceae bacterium]|nr:hypothetical protein [Flammeovirgaceae bacterium]